MSWMDHYNARLTSAEQAVGAIRPGNRIWIHAGCASPEALLDAMISQAGRLHDVEVVQMLTLGRGDHSHPAFEGIFRVNALFIGGNVRTAVQEGRADYTPIFLHEIEGLFTSGAMELDAALISVSAPDSHGYVSLGVGVDCTMAAAKMAKVLIAEVNSQMPRTHGDTFLHISEIDHIVETSHPLPEMKVEPYGELHRRIAQHVASLIPDGAVLQMGIGEVPDAVLSYLTHHKDLGIHTEMFSDGVVPLVQSGVINGRRKTLHPGKLVAGFVLGTRKLFEFIHDNPAFEFHPIAYVNDPFVIAQNDRMVAINSALQVDLTGQVCSDSIGTKPYSGFGGQVDYMRGAAHSKGGVPMIALPSTAKNGTISRIAPVLDPGAGVVTSRADVHYVVTEHGIAYMHGKTLRQRAQALISIADPLFRDGLYEFAYKAHYLEPKTMVIV